jgi:hypothetical protein
MVTNFIDASGHREKDVKELKWYIRKQEEEIRLYYKLFFGENFENFTLRTFSSVSIILCFASYKHIHDLI